MNIQSIQGHTLTIEEKAAEKMYPSDTTKMTYINGHFAITILQKNIRRKNVQDTAVMPSELRTAWSSINELALKADKVKEEFSLIITRKLQEVLADPSLYGKEIYVSKRTEYKLHRNELQPDEITTSPWTFYVKVDPKSQMAIVELNEAKGLIGEGTYKKVYRGYELTVPLKVNKNGRLTAVWKTAISRPKVPSQFDEKLRIPAEMQQEASERAEKKGLRMRVTGPLRVREHLGGKELDKKKQELIQHRYAGDLVGLSKTRTYDPGTGTLPLHISYDAHLSLIEDLFETVDILNSLGFTHRDIREANILIGEESDGLHSYLHDPDLIESSALGQSYKYGYWDMGGQIGIVSHASDIIGSMLTGCKLLFPSSKAIERELIHMPFKQTATDVFKGIIFPELKEKLREAKLTFSNSDVSQQKAIAQLKKYLNEPLISDNKRLIVKKLLAKTNADIKILQAFCKVFKKEEAWKDQLLGSCFCHFANLTSEEYAHLQKSDPLKLKELFVDGKDKWAKDQLYKILGNRGLTMLKLTEKEFSEISTIDLFDDLTLHYGSKQLSLFYTSGEICKYYKLDEKLDSLIALYSQSLPAEGDQELFSLLNSEDPDEREKGREIGFKVFGRGKDLQNEIRIIREEYLAEINEK